MALFKTISPVLGHPHFPSPSPTSLIPNPLSSLSISFSMNLSAHAIAPPHTYPSLIPITLNCIAKPSFIFDSVENDDDVKRGLAAMEFKFESVIRGIRSLWDSNDPCVEISGNCSSISPNDASVAGRWRSASLHVHLALHLLHSFVRKARGLEAISAENS
ncbi:hypothetical protein PVL29_022203 [Vitis rotundifolia]|uniref:Uncharacterized protein n=1 Tax=Vitis rotundifolia TaxID=103349 RepID=A0AA38YUX6_VITRO|nr:hypothetical protein PVL29_022203 [Vitis rotundifolia]